MTVRACYGARVVRRPNRLNVVLGEGSVAKSSALHDDDPDARTITALLDRIEGAFEEAQRGLEEGRQEPGIRLEDLS